MKILIVTATKQEISLVGDRSIEILITGIGIPNTILNLTRHLNKIRYDLIINIGVCGSFHKGYMIGDVVEIIKDQFSEIGYEDNEGFQFFDNSFQLDTVFEVPPKTKLASVNGITVNTVHGNEESIKNVILKINPDVESMEGAACMMVSERFGIPFMQIRGISNHVEQRNTDNWDLDLAIINVNMELDNIISKL